MQLNDGRFACGLNFGNAAFDGSNRWIQVEFRNPAGSGQYLALSPRDKITATPYALYALNGANGVWVYDTNQQSVSVVGKKVGIGTSNPTAALEVVSATGGDDSVKLPAGSIGRDELAVSFPQVVRFEGQVDVGNPVITRSFSTTSAMAATFLISASGVGSGQFGQVGLSLSIDGVQVWGASAGGQSQGGSFSIPSAFATVPVSAGSHLLVLSVSGYANYSGSLRTDIVLTNELVTAH
jgi:hypothetical protein